MAARGGRRAHPLLRRAHEQPRAAHLSVSGGPSLAPHAVAAEPERPRHLGPDAAAYRPLVACCPRVSSLSPAATWRYHLRQEPDAGNPLVRICGGGDQRWSFLLRLGEVEVTGARTGREPERRGSDADCQGEGRHVRVALSHAAASTAISTAIEMQTAGRSRGMNHLQRRNDRLIRLPRLCYRM